MTTDEDRIEQMINDPDYFKKAVAKRRAEILAERACQGASDRELSLQIIVNWMQDFHWPSALVGVVIGAWGYVGFFELVKWLL